MVHSLLSLEVNGRLLGLEGGGRGLGRGTITFRGVGLEVGKCVIQ